MSFQRSLLIALALGSLPVLAACTQTAAPALPVTANADASEESGVLAAIKDAQRTQARHQANSALMSQASAFDPTGLSGYAIDQIERQQERIEEEKYRLIDEEMEKALAEAEALQTDSERQELRKASAGKQIPSRRKITP